MNTKNIIYVVVIVLLVSFIYVSAQRGMKSGQICPATPVIEQNTQPTAPGSKKATTGTTVTFIELGSVGCRPCDMMKPILAEIEKE